MVTIWTATFCRNGRIKTVTKHIFNCLGQDSEVVIERIIKRFRNQGWFMSTASVKVLGLNQYRNN